MSDERLDRILTRHRAALARIDVPKLKADNRKKASEAKARAEAQLVAAEAVGDQELIKALRSLIR